MPRVGGSRASLSALAIAVRIGAAGAARLAQNNAMAASGSLSCGNGARQTGVMAGVGGGIW